MLCFVDDHGGVATEAEWEYAWHSGAIENIESEIPHDTLGNIPDASAKRKFNLIQIWAEYDDGYTYTAPVMSYKPNKAGLYDIRGNVAEWCWD